MELSANRITRCQAFGVVQCMRSPVDASNFLTDLFLDFMEKFPGTEIPQLQTKKKKMVNEKVAMQTLNHHNLYV